MIYRVLVTGSRHWPAEFGWFIERKLEGLNIYAKTNSDVTSVVIVHGACPTGVDRLADLYVKRGLYHWLTAEPHPADWEAHGKRAGMLRNAEMVKLGADVRIAFPDAGSRGTKDCYEKAIAAGIPTYVWPLTYAQRLAERR